MSKTLEEKQTFIELRAKGYSFAKIAEEIGVSKQTLITWSQDDQTFRDITNLKALYIDELQEKYAITKQHRIEAFGELLERVRKELSSRDLSTVPTDKLVLLLIKMADTIRQDETEITLLGEPVIDFFDIAAQKRWTV